MSDKLDRFTKRARRVLTLAQEEALRLNHNYIGTEHLLLGLVREENGVAGIGGDLAMWFRKAGMTFPRSNASFTLFICSLLEVCFMRKSSLRFMANPSEGWTRRWWALKAKDPWRP